MTKKVQRAKLFFLGRVMFINRPSRHPPVCVPHWERLVCGTVR